MTLRQPITSVVRIERIAIRIAYHFGLIQGLHETEKVKCNFIPGTDVIILHVCFDDKTYYQLKFDDNDLLMSLDDLAEGKIYSFILQSLPIDKKFIHMDYT